MGWNCKEIVPTKPHALFKVKDESDEDDWGMKCAVVFHQEDSKFHLYRRRKLREEPYVTKTGLNRTLTVYQYHMVDQAGFKTAKQVVEWAQMMYLANGQNAF